MSNRVFGHVSGTMPGDVFETRWDLHLSRIHPPPVAGISGSQKEGADSIVISGGYEDDVDEGNRIVYTGSGGNDPNTGAQVADQKLTLKNKALAVSCDRGLPVRVTRGWRGDPRFSPARGYRYDGL